MKSLKHVLRSGLFLLGLCFSVFSCDMFQHSIPQYFKNYTEQILPGKITPCAGMPFERASDGTYIIPSTLDEDYCFSFYYNDPQDRPYIKLCYINPSSPNTSNDFPTYAPDEEYYAILDHDKSFCKLCFKSSYLKSKDLESGERNIKFTLLFKYSFSPDFINTDANGVETMYFNFNCIVNTKPDILEDEMKAAKGTFTDNKKNILCFNLKPEVQNLYDDIKNADGKYQINIDGKNYEFTFEGGKPVFTDTEHFFYSQSTITGLSGNLEFENIFEEGQNPVYFVTNDNAERDYTILVTDAHGLKSPYKISTRPSGHQSLELISTQYSDYLQITPKFVTIPAKPGENPLTLNKVTLVYSINNEEQQTHDFTTSDPFKIYVPGGTTSIYYYMKAEAQDVNTSQAKTATFTKDNKMYASASPSDSSYKGGSSSTPTTIKDALDYICHQSGEWNLYLEQGEYMATQDDIVTDAKAFIYLKKYYNGQEIKINIQGEANDKRAIFNAKQLGRVLYANGIEVSLKYVNLTGGQITDYQGAGITSTANLKLENCDIYGNKTLKQQNNDNSSGGGIYHGGDGSVFITNCKIYNNTAASRGGGIYIFGTTDDESKIQIKNTQIYSNKASSGGGIYNSKGMVFIYGGSLIGADSQDTAKYQENSNEYSNRANHYGGGIHSRDGSIRIGYYLDENLELKEDNIQNYIKYNSANYGGGIYSEKSKIFMNKGSIDLNYANSDGGGVYLVEQDNGNISRFNIKNASMSQNVANSVGGAVYVPSKDRSVFMTMGQVTIQGTLKNNDVYLKGSETLVTLDENSELDNSSKITITLGDYNNENAKITGAAATVIAQKYKCFSLTPNNGTNYYLTPKAVLTEYQPAETLTSDPSSSDKIGAFSPADINNIAALVENGTSDFSGVTITLQEDLTLNRTNYTSMGTRTNTVNHPFKGIFDGNGKTITFTECNKPLFRYTNGATIKNINITGTFTGVGDTHLGPIIQIMYGGTLQNCKSTCNISVSGGNTIGGFVGFAYGSEENNGYYTRNCIIDSCINNGYINAPNTPYVGGIAGSARVCFIRNCAQKNDVKGKIYVGGIAARIDGKGDTSTELDGIRGTIIQNCYVRGNITATEGSEISDKMTCYAGGIAGYYDITEASQKAKFQNLYYYGTITIPNQTEGTKFQKGAIFGTTCSSTNCPVFENCYIQSLYTACDSYDPGAGVTTATNSIATYAYNFNSWVSSNSSVSINGTLTFKSWDIDNNFLKFSGEY